jgi:hypothetical protein
MQVRPSTAKPTAQPAWQADTVGSAGLFNLINHSFEKLTALLTLWQDLGRLQVEVAAGGPVALSRGAHPFGIPACKSSKNCKAR